MLAELLLFGLVVAGTSFAENLDFTAMKGPLEMLNFNPNWVPPPITANHVKDSSEHGVTPGPIPTSCRCGMANRSGRRIVGGRPHGPNEYPWIVGIAASHTPHRPHCGGSIISPWHVLTAAHCYSGQPLGASVGDYSRGGFPSKFHPGIKTFIHENYNQQNMRHDIALIFLATPILETPNVGLVCLPRDSNPLHGQEMRFIGWGAERFQGPMTITPKKTDVPVVPITSCSMAWQGMVSPSPQTQICTHSRSTTPCQGDSGGPVTYRDPTTNRYHQYGIVSFGPRCETVIPSVQTYVPYYLSWILSKIQATVPGQQTCR
uniref:Venom S1 protease 5 n=1 Tax=Ectomocoris sp. TaxID=3104572 RepID=A0AB38ZE63_9HEMI